MFPSLNTPFSHAEQGMGQRNAYVQETLESSFVSPFQFFLEMEHFKLQLPLCHRKFFDHCHLSQFSLVKSIPTMLRFSPNCEQVRVDVTKWATTFSKSGKLRMETVSFGTPLQDFSGKQRLPPQGDETERIKILWME